jgi:hypothetical protein
MSASEQTEISPKQAANGYLSLSLVESNKNFTTCAKMRLKEKLKK